MLSFWGFGLFVVGGCFFGGEGEEGEEFFDQWGCHCVVFFKATPDGMFGVERSKCVEMGVLLDGKACEDGLWLLLEHFTWLLSNHLEI